MRKTALVTGASAGIGRELVRLFAAEGHDVVVVARREERLQELAEELGSKVKIHVEARDLLDPDEWTGLHEDLKAKGIAIDYLVNNAGFGSNGKFWELDRQWELDQIQLNVKALVALTHIFLPSMIERGHGRILNIASTAGFQPGPYMSTYYATKAFVLSFTEGIAVELDGTGVTATAHCPGPTDSEFGDIAGNKDKAIFKAQVVATSEEVAKHAYRAMHKGKPVAVQGAANTLTTIASQLGPRALVRNIAGKLNR